MTQSPTTKAHFLTCAVILGFLAPDKVDNKFFDPKFAFKEVEVQAKTVTELVTKKKPKVCLGNMATLTSKNWGDWAWRVLQTPQKGLLNLYFLL